MRIVYNFRSSCLEALRKKISVLTILKGFGGKYPWWGPVLIKLKGL